MFSKYLFHLRENKEMRERCISSYFSYCDAIRVWHDLSLTTYRTSKGINSNWTSVLETHWTEYLGAGMIYGERNSRISTRNYEGFLEQNENNFGRMTIPSIDDDNLVMFNSCKNISYYIRGIKATRRPLLIKELWNNKF